MHVDRSVPVSPSAVSTAAPPPAMPLTADATAPMAVPTPVIAPVPSIDPPTAAPVAPVVASLLAPRRLRRLDEALHVLEVEGRRGDRRSLRIPRSQGPSERGCGETSEQGAEEHSAIHCSL